MSDGEDGEDAEDAEARAEAHADAKPTREQWAPRICVVVAIGLALLYAFAGAGVGDFCLDDAWIHLAYAKSLRLGDGLSYNPGDRETGFSSPLWVALLAAWPTEPDPVDAVKLLGALLHGACAGLAGAITLDLASARASVRRPLPVFSIALLAGVTCATAPTLLQGASSGMEVALAACLILACLHASLRGQWLLAGLAGLAAQLARPEALACFAGFVVVAWIGEWIERRSRPSLIDAAKLAAPVLGAGAGLGLWVIYCLAVSGWPWPNTAYVKASVGQDASLGIGLEYVADQVLPWQPWFVSVGGLALIAAALWSDLSGRGVLERSPDPNPGPNPGPRPGGDDAERAPRWQLLALVAAYLAGMIGTAASRPLEPGILFFQARYFAIFAGLPPIVLALGIARTHRLLAAALVLPVALLTGLQIDAAHELQRAQERGVALLHGDPAGYVARELPPDAVIAVEGAGAMRYRTPRTMTIIDVIGLNDAAIAHADGDSAKACVLVARAPGYFVLPQPIAAALARVFEMQVLAEFVDPRWAQVEEPHEVRVLLLAVDGPRPRWAARCADAP